MRLDPRRKAQLKANKEAARQRAREYVANYFATHPCADCGESDPVVLSFDHVRGTKRGNVSDMIRDGLGLETIKAEIEKCDVVCERETDVSVSCGDSIGTRMSRSTGCHQNREAAALKAKGTCISS